MPAQDGLVNPVVKILSAGYDEHLNAKIDLSGVTPDANGFYYKPTDLVMISADETVKKADGTAAPFGVVTYGVTDGRLRGEELIPDNRTRINVVPFRYNTAVIRMTASSNITAGQAVVIDPANPGRVMAGAFGPTCVGICWIGGGEESTIQVVI
jgi:hypothetical protein